MTAPSERKQMGAGPRQKRGLYFSGKGGVQVRVGLDGQGKEMSSNFWSSILRSSRKRVGVRMCEEPGQEGRVGVDASVPDTSQPGRLSPGDQALALSTPCTHRGQPQPTPPGEPRPLPSSGLSGTSSAEVGAKHPAVRPTS